LLDDVRELVCQEARTLDRPRGVPALGEHDILPDGVGQRADLTRRLGRGWVRVNSDIPEIVPESRTKDPGRFRGKGRPG
jgi:hypothetical protein